MNRKKKESSRIIVKNKMVRSKEDELMRCESALDFVNFARKNGAIVRKKNHYFIDFGNGVSTTLSCTPRRNIVLHKTRKIFREVYNIG